MMDLETRLQRTGMYRQPGIPRVEASPPASDPPLETLVEGQWIEIPAGGCFMAQETYALEHFGGDAPLADLLSLPLETWTPFLSGQDETLDPREALFLDTETTGLVSGVSQAFLVGIGFFDEQGFTVRQYFMPDYADESALLELLANEFGAHHGLITFNGRAFDWPILATRYLITRHELPSSGTPHLDLLLLARRLWHRLLPSCALSCLEQQVLGLVRDDNDVPGYLIPQLYTEYIQQGRTRPMASVFYHNAVDVLSMVTLADRIGHLLRPPEDCANDPYCDPLALGRLRERLGQADRAVAWYRLARQTRDELTGEQADKHLSLLLKRLGRHDEATVIWEQRLEGLEPYPYIELAKQLEHRLHDYGRALTLVEQAIARAENRSFATVRDGQRLLSELQHRSARLQRRLASRG